MQNSDTSNDFGFSLVSEEELKQAEIQLRDQVQIKESEKMDLESLYKKRISDIRSMIRPLLLNLTKDPEKTHIFWPQRAKIVGDFAKKLDKLFDQPVV